MFDPLKIMSRSSSKESIYTYEKVERIISSEISCPGSANIQQVIGNENSCSQPGSAVIRQVDSETGEGQTIVTDERGGVSTFSQETVSSVMTGAFRSACILPDDPALARKSLKRQKVERDAHGRIQSIDDESISDVALMKRWMGSLPKLKLIGFDNELRIRLSDLWTQYSKAKAEHDDYIENADYIFFGLDRDATLTDLEKAFRKLAKTMHPDKNCGSEEAKARFQDLKERYENLRKKIKSREGKLARSDDAEQKELLDEGQAYRENQDDEVGSSVGSSEDTSAEARKEEEIDRDAIEVKIWELVDTAKAMQRQMRRWRERLERASGG